MFLSDQHNIKEVLLFPAMKPDENDARTSSVFKAAKALAAQTRAAQAKDMLHHGGGGGGSAPHVAASVVPAAAANPTFAAINAQLQTGGGSFLGGLQPGAADRAAYELVVKTLGQAGSAAVPGALAGYPALQGWFGLVALFSESARAAWSS
jgi:hypothetical protein